MALFDFGIVDIRPFTTRLNPCRPCVVVDFRDARGTRWILGDGTWFKI